MHNIPWQVDVVFWLLIHWYVVPLVAAAAVAIALWWKRRRKTPR